MKRLRKWFLVSVCATTTSLWRLRRVYRQGRLPFLPIPISGSTKRYRIYGRFLWQRSVSFWRFYVGRTRVELGADLVLYPISLDLAPIHKIHGFLPVIRWILSPPKRSSASPSVSPVATMSSQLRCYATNSLLSTPPTPSRRCISTIPIFAITSPRMFSIAQYSSMLTPAPFNLCEY